MTGVRTWFEARSLREKRLILVMLALLAVTIIWAGVIRPLGDALADARERHSDAVTRLGETEARVEAVRRLARSGPSQLGGSLADAVRLRADEAGFSIGSLDAETPDRVRISIPSARPGALFGWLGEQERRGLLVDALDTSDNGDRTVSARITLAARGR